MAREMNHKQKQLPVFYTVKEFRDIFNISESTFGRWRRKGLFQTIQVTHKALIAESEVNRLLSESGYLKKAE